MAEDSHAAAVVGATGFIGTALSRELETRGVRVIRVTADEPATRDGLSLRPDMRAVSTVYWAASRINPQIAAERPDLVAQDLADFRAFQSAAARQIPDATIVLLSSGGTVYGSAQPPHSESTTPRPTSDYGRSKLELERLLGRGGTRSVIVRVSNAYGPGQPPAPGQGVIGHWLRALLHQEPVTVFGDLKTVRDYVFVSDVVDLLARLHGSVEVPEILNVGSGTPTPLATVVDAIHTVVGNRHLEIEFEPRRPFDLPAAWLDVSLAAERLGWSATTELTDGVAQMWSWLCSPAVR